MLCSDRIRILGISAFYHDSAACLISDGDIVAAAQEERFTRKRHDSAFPSEAARYCLMAGDIRPEQIDYVVFYDKPLLKFERIFETYLAFAPKGFNGFLTSMPIWLKEKALQKKIIVRCLLDCFGVDVNWMERLRFSEHHLSHAASAFFPSPFRDAAVLTIDGVGEWTTTAVSVGSGNQLSIRKEIRFPHSLGLLYSAFTYYTGFKVNSGEYKVMGLAPYGHPLFADLIRKHLIDIKEDGSYHLDMRYFNYCNGLTMTNQRFHRLFGGRPRDPEGPLIQRHMDLAASIQAVIEDVVIKLAKDVRRSTRLTKLCLAGGVALNCVANGKLLKTGVFDEIWVQPSAGDAGGALGAALAAYHLMLGKQRCVRPQDSMQGAFLGPGYTQLEIEKRLDGIGAVFCTVESEDALVDIVAKALAAGSAVGWHQGRMEFGPRALGGRSILADPRSASAQRQLNLKVKHRESFRPFAPSVLQEELSDWFGLCVASPYMLLVAEVIEKRRKSLSDSQKRLRGLDKLSVLRSEIPAVTHVDYSARVQTVHRETNPTYHRLISRFKALTKCPLLVNTSFNVRGEPIVCTPEDAFRCFINTDIELLAIGRAILRKQDQRASQSTPRDSAHEND